MPENVILVDLLDNPIGQEDKLTAHQNALLHRAFSIFIMRMNPEGVEETLLQQRHPAKYHCGGLWSNACCSHPRPGESTATAANRRLQEELGLSIALTHKGSFCYRAQLDNGLVEHELDHVFIGYWQGEAVTPHPGEISAVRWLPVTGLREQLVKQEREFTPWLAEALQIASPMS